MSLTPTIESSPLLRRIRQRLDALAPLKNGLVRLSVADEPRWEKSDGGDEVLVRWACWSIEDDGAEVSEPEFEVLSKDVTRSRLEDELPRNFSDVRIVVDNDIDMSES